MLGMYLRYPILARPTHEMSFPGLHRIMEEAQSDAWTIKHAVGGICNTMKRNPSLDWTILCRQLAEIRLAADGGVRPTCHLILFDMIASSLYILQPMVHPSLLASSFHFGRTSNHLTTPQCANACLLETATFLTPPCADYWQW